MKMLHTAWRNIWRNKGRTLLSASAIFVSTLVMCLMFSLENAYIDDMVNNIKNHVTGDIRIMNRAYTENERVTPLQFYVEGTHDLLAKLNALGEVRLATARTETGVSIYRNGEQIPCRAIGIDFEKSPVMSGKNNHIVAGSAPRPRSAEVLITDGLARELGLSVGSKFTAITRTAISGSNGMTFTVAGVISMSDSDFSGRLFFMDWNTASVYLRMDGNALQLQVFLADQKKTAEGLAAVRLAAGGDKLEVIPWDKVSGMYGFLKMANVIYTIYGAIFYLLASTVIFNTTMMSVLERKREIGTLAALGMGKGRIVSLFLTESALIAFVGTVAGLVIGGLLIALWNHAGFNIQAIYGTDLKGFGFSKIVYPSLGLKHYVYTLVMGVAISTGACWIPANMASRIEPADALADR